MTSAPASSFLRVLERKRKLNELIRQQQSLLQEINQHFDKTRKEMQTRQQLEMAKIRVKELEMQLASEGSFFEREEREFQEKKKAMLPQAEELLNAQQQLIEHSRRVSEHRLSIAADMCVSPSLYMWLCLQQLVRMPAEYPKQYCSANGRS